MCWGERGMGSPWEESEHDREDGVGEGPGWGSERAD